MNGGINYRTLGAPGSVSQAFVASNARARALVGPMLSGKTTTLFLDIVSRAIRNPRQRQWRQVLVAPDKTYLDTHVIPRIQELVAGSGHWPDGAIRSVILPLNDSKGAVFAEIELVFLGLDERAHRARFLGMETTGACLLDLRNHFENVIDDALAAIGTYPLDSGGALWKGITGVSRMPRRGHWLYARVERGDIELFRQPGGRSPAAENLANLAKRKISYHNLARNLSADRVRLEIDCDLALDQVEAAAEATRQDARENLTRFIGLVMPDIRPAVHHKLLIAKLEAVARSKIKRLMIFLPPGAAKSTYASILFPAWYMGRHPTHPVIAASHAKELAERFGRRVRNIVDSPIYRDIFGFGLAEDSGAAGRWETARGGEYYAVGVDGSVTGRRAALGIIDDPVKGRAEADSPTVRNHTWEWYKSDFWTRLLPDAAVIYIGTRWHEDDLAGRLLEEQKAGGEQWEVVSIPAVAVEGREDLLGRQPGERLWPEHFTAEMIENARRDLRNWSALYQQEPMPESGDFFQRDWVRWYDTSPPREQMRTYGASDYAVRANAGDYTAHIVVGIDQYDDIYLLDLWRGQTASDKWVETLLDLMQRWKTLWWGEEKGQIEKGVGPFITKRQLERKIYGPRKQYSSVADKATRAQSFRGRMAMGKVYFPARAPWAAELIDELLRFPAGKNDDQVDACSLIGRMLDELIPGSRPVASPPEYNAVPEFFFEPVNGSFAERVQITMPGAPGLNTVIVMPVTDQHKRRWPEEYAKFFEESEQRLKNGEPLPGLRETPSAPGGAAELPRLGARLEATAIPMDKIWDTAPGRSLDPYRRDYPRRI